MSLSKALNILLVPVKHQQCKISKRGYTRSQNGPGPSINWLWCQKYDFRNYENIEHKEVIQVTKVVGKSVCRKVVLRAQMPERWEDQVMQCCARHWKVLWNLTGLCCHSCAVAKKNHLFLGQDTDIQDPYKLENLHDKWHINIVVQIMTTRLRACNAIYPVLKPDKIQLHIQLFRY